LGELGRLLRGNLYSGGLIIWEGGSVGLGF